MREFPSENREMQALEFCKEALHTRVAPPTYGSVKARINRCARHLKWSPSRVRDVWYADPRVSLKAEELKQIERESGISYARKEIEELEHIERKLVELLGQDQGFRSLIAGAVREALRSMVGPGSQNGDRK